MESQAFITSTKKTPTCDVLGPSGLVIDLFLLCQAGNLLKIRSTRLRSVFLQMYKLYPCIYSINNVSINQLWMIWPGKRAERRGVGEVLGLCLHWGSWGDPHFQKKYIFNRPLLLWKSLSQVITSAFTIHSSPFFYHFNHLVFPFARGDF